MYETYFHFTRHHMIPSLGLGLCLTVQHCTCFVTNMLSVRFVYDFIYISYLDFSGQTLNYIHMINCVIKKLVKFVQKWLKY